MSLNTFHTSQYVPLMFIQNIEFFFFFFSKLDLTFFTQMKVGTYFILVSFMAHPMSFLAPFLNALDLHLDTCITHYVVPNFHFSSIVKLLKRKEKDLLVCVGGVHLGALSIPLHTCHHPSSHPYHPASLVDHLFVFFSPCHFLLLASYINWFFSYLQFPPQHPQHPNHLLVFEKTLLSAFSFLKSAIIIT